MIQSSQSGGIELLQGTLDMLVLRTFQWGPQHGHGIAQTIRAQSDDLLTVETGSLYPALHRLEKRGWLKSQWGVSEANQRAKFYRLTAAESAQLLREQDRWSQLVTAIGASEPGTCGGAEIKAMSPDHDDLTTKSAVTWRSASRSASSAARIRNPPAWPR